MNRGFQAPDGEAFFRAARAAQALGQTQDANTLLPCRRPDRRSGGRNRLGRALPRDVQARRGPEVVPNRPQEQRRLGPAPTSASRARSRARIRRPRSPQPKRRSRSIRELADAHLLLAELELDNTRYDEARERIDRVLKSNPSHLDARALLGAIAYVRDDKPAFEAEVARVLAINPAFGEVYRVAGDLAARNYRFDEAVALTRQAVALDPSNTRALSDLGLHLMRTGDEAEARRSLDRPFKAFPFDQVTFNLLALLDKLEKFEVVQKATSSSSSIPTRRRSCASTRCRWRRTR